MIYLVEAKIFIDRGQSLLLSSTNFIVPFPYGTDGATSGSVATELVVERLGIQNLNIILSIGMCIR